ncbi:MAG: Uma2 family endonuclease [Akkermansiaceae bacterium]|jgi:Uma2 family endonuclease|nr:Uma2 family endonuclease [Akkermansiaceae bacterium]
MQLVIDLPPREEQIAYNRKRWQELCEDPQLARWPGRIETNAHGNILMSPPPSGIHSSRQGEITFLLRQILGGRALPECPVSTIDGVRSADVGWYSNSLFAEVSGQTVFEQAPEICVEILSPSNSPSEIREKRKLYFDAGAREVWICDLKGTMSFFCSTDEDIPSSHLCPDFPPSIA